MISKIKFERQRDRDRQGESRFLSAGSFPKCLQHPGLARAEARNQELTPGFPCESQEPGYFSNL